MPIVTALPRHLTIQSEVESRTQGSRPRPRTAFRRTDTLEAKDRNARGQGPRTQAKKKKKGLHKNFSGDLQKKTTSDLHENTFSKKIFQALHKILTIQKLVLSSSRGQANFRGLEASRPRTSKSVLEDSTSEYNVRFHTLGINPRPSF